MKPDPYKYFRLEARDLVDQLQRGTLELDRGGAAPEIVQRLLRVAHTLKGAARVVKQRELADRAHALEDVLAPFREAALVPREQVDRLLEITDHLARDVAAIPPPPGAEPAPAAGPDPQAVLRTEVSEMERLLEGVGEAHAQVAALRRAAAPVEQARRLAERLAEQLGSRAHRGTAGIERAGTAAETLRLMLVTLERGLGSGMEQVERELGEVRELAEQLRLISASGMFTALERTARDAARALGREVIFEARSTDVRFDAQMLATVQGALVQLTRNAVAHGIEAEAVRLQAGKPAAGRVTIEVERRGTRVAFRCTDDGCGIDEAALRRAAAARGVPDVETRGLRASELMQLLIGAGITTSSSVTAVAGRGVGLDVVREAAQRLGGHIRVRTEPGAGTTFELEVPQIIASLEALLVESAGVAAAIPLEAVRSTLRVSTEEVSRAAAGEVISAGGRVVPFVPLRRVLRAPELEHARQWSAVVVGAPSGAVAVGVDRLLGTSNLILRPIPAHARADAIVAGAALDATGTPQLVLDPEGLVAAARAQPPPPREQAAPRPILVVDDSLTTRMLEQSILESAGYAVDTATSGEEALERARDKHYALFLVDVEMPRMDGFTLIERMRAHPVLQDVPAILVTSRGTAEDKARGLAAGAQGYIVKSEFDQGDLLAHIARLVG